MSLTISNNQTAEYNIGRDSVKLRIRPPIAFNYAGSSASDAQRTMAVLQATVKSISANKVQEDSIQNRLENLLTKLRIQAENLQSAKTRVLDAQAAAAMTSFVCDQILRPQLGPAPQNATPKLALNLL